MPTTPPPESPPATLVDAIRSNLLTDAAEKFSDVTLVGRDGGRVPAVRALLGVRSLYFRKRFFANYQDKESPTHSVEVSTPALREVVQYAYTDDTRLLRRAFSIVSRAKARAAAAAASRPGRKRTAAETAAAADAAEVAKPLGMEPADVVLLVELITAADYFSMAGLTKRAADALVALVEAVPRTTCLVLEAARRQPAVQLVAPAVLQAARRILRRFPQDCLLVEDFRRAMKRSKGPGGSPALLVVREGLVDAGVLMLSAETLEEILKDDDLFTSETYLFQVLYYWATDGVVLDSLWKMPLPADVLIKEKGVGEMGGTGGSKGTDENDSGDEKVADRESTKAAGKGRSTGANRGVAENEAAHKNMTDWENSGVRKGKRCETDSGAGEKDRAKGTHTDKQGAKKRTAARRGDSELKVGSPDKKKRRKSTVALISKPASPGTGGTGPPAGGSRWEQAKKMVCHINLERLKPSFVRDYVERTGLVEREKILQVYQQQALEAERGRALYDSFRGGSVWHTGTKRLLEESSSGYRSRVLMSPWIRSGRHEWTFKLEEESDCTWFGVASVIPDETSFFGNDATGWAYATQGTCTQAGRMQRRIGPGVEVGKTVRMILNLTKNGTLTVIVDGNKKSFRAFSDMKAGAKQFVPVVYLKRPACVTLVSERHMME